MTQVRTLEQAVAEVKMIAERRLADRVEMFQFLVAIHRVIYSLGAADRAEYLREYEKQIATDFGRKS